VDPYATGAQDGSSWDDALLSVQQGIDEAAASSEPYCEVWVAEGVYRPSALASTDFIVLAPDVHVYGGFDRTEQSRSARDWEQNLTELNGCHQVGPGIWDCVHHVVHGASYSILDGFTITGGKADGSLPEHQRGGGMLIDGITDLRIANCTFTDNHAVDGGAIYSKWATSLEISRCRFIDNSAVYGGAIYSTRGADRLITNSLLVANYAEYGAALYNFTYQWADTPELINSGLFGNVATATLGGGAVYNSESLPRIANCILWGNEPTSIVDFNSEPTVIYSDVEGGYFGTGNIDQDPELANVPLLWDRTVDPGGTDYVVVADWSRYATGDVIELGDDGLQRSVVDIRRALDQVQFSPALSDPTSDGMLVANWGPSPTSVHEDFHLRASSPCIDSANDADAPDEDLEGNPRCGTADMGAYEHQSPSCP
jgi:predicted outer membrane repeat protein